MENEIRILDVSSACSGKQDALDIIIQMDGKKVTFYDCIISLDENQEINILTDDFKVDPITLH
jgi:hypothetical protein